VYTCVCERLCLCLWQFLCLYVSACPCVVEMVMTRTTLLHRRHRPHAVVLETFGRMTPPRWPFDHLLRLPPCPRAQTAARHHAAQTYRLSSPLCQRALLCVGALGLHHLHALFRRHRPSSSASPCPANCLYSVAATVFFLPPSILLPPRWAVGHRHPEPFLSTSPVHLNVAKCRGFPECLPRHIAPLPPTTHSHTRIYTHTLSLSLTRRLSLSLSLTRARARD